MRNFFLNALAMVAFTMPALAETMTIGSTAYEVTRTEQQVAKGVKYTVLNFPNRSYTGYTGGSRVHVIEADLSDPSVSIELANHNSLSGTRTLNTHASEISSSSKKAVAGANANFWITSETPWKKQMPTMPWGVAVRNGVMYTEPNAKSLPHCGGPSVTGLIAVDNNGRVIIDRLKPQAADNTVGSGFQFTAYHKRIAHRLDLDMCNRMVNAGTASIYTKEYGATKAFKPVDSNCDIVEGVSTEVLLDFAEAESWHIGGSTKFIVKEVRNNAGTGTLGDHDLAIVGRDSYASVLSAYYTPGDEIEIETFMNFENRGTPAAIAQATSGNVIAMTDGVFNAAHVNPAPINGNSTYNKNSNERTVYATNPEGNKLWILVCEHNVKQTKKYFGFNLEQMCDIARNLGATDATQVDCGGSAQMWAGGAQVSQSYDSSGTRGVYSGLFVLSTDLGSIQTVNPDLEPEPETPEASWQDRLSATYNGNRGNIAYNLSSSGDPINGYDITYTLTGSVKNVAINLTNIDDNSVITLSGTTAKGVNKVHIAPSQLDKDASYNWDVTVTSNPVTGCGAWATYKTVKADSRCGVGIVTNPESGAFGKIIISQGYANGLTLLTPEMSEIGRYHQGFSPWNATNRSDTYRVAMRDGAVAYVNCFSDKGAGFWKFDPESPETAPTNLSEGTNDGKGCITYNGAVTGTGASGIGFTGQGASTRLWAFAEDWPTGNSSYKGIVARWDIGNAEKITTAVNAAYDQFVGTGLFANQNVNFTPYKEGVFLAQNRTDGMNNTTCPGFIYTDIYGTVHYNSASQRDIIPACGGSVAITADGSMMAIPQAKGMNIRLYSVTWNGMVPTLDYLGEIPNSSNSTSGEISQMVFDIAGNLYAFYRSATASENGVKVFAIANSQPTATTPAKSAFLIVGPEDEGGDTGEEKPQPVGDGKITDLQLRWIYSTNVGNLADAPWFLSSGTPTRDMCYADGKVYVLNAAAGGRSINILNAEDGKQSGSLSVDGISGGTIPLANLKALGNTVIGSNMAGATGELKIYKWNNDNSAPEIWFNTTAHGGVEVGRQMNTFGTMDDGIIAFGNYTSASAVNHVVYFTVKNGVVNPTPVVIELGKLGGNASNQHVIFEHDGSFWLIHKDAYPVHFSPTGQKIEEVKAAHLSGGKVYGTGGTVFHYGRYKYLAMTATLGSATSSAWGNGTMHLLDITNGTDNSTEIGKYPAEGFGAAAWGGVGVNTVHHSISDDGSKVAFYSLVPSQGIAKYEFVGLPTDVEIIGADDSNDSDEAQWFNLQGIKVNPENLAPGIYIRKQGSKADKVLVK